MTRFLGLSDEDVAQLSIETRYSPGEGVFQTDARPFLRVTHTIPIDEGRDPSKYVACFCYTGRHAAGDAATVYYKNDSDRVRIGYVFPSTAFAEPTVWEDTWQSRFAEVAFRKLVNFEKIKLFSVLSSVPDEKEIDRSFDEVFSQDVAVLVLSKSALKGLRMTEPEIELSLLHAGISVLRAKVTGGYTEPNKMPQGHYTLRRASRVAGKDAHAFVDLLRRADADQTGVGAFLSYYQTIEYCIDHILNWSIRDIATSAANAWDIKDALSKVANEKYRISQLEADFLSNAKDREVFASLADEATRFIAIVSDEKTEDWGWGQLVYKARNIVVHNQLSLLRSGRLDEVKILNRKFRQVCLEILIHFQSKSA